MQLFGIILLYLVGLSGSGRIFSKKRALTSFKIRQLGGRCQMRRHLGEDGLSRLVTHALLYNEDIHRKASRIPFATLPLKDLRIHHQHIFVNARIMGTAHN